MKRLLILAVRFYQKYLSPLKKQPTCRFTPTCSAYAIEAFQKRGFFVGFILTVWRILRCNPFSKGGYDPVPEKGLRNRDTSKIKEEDNKKNEDETPSDTDRLHSDEEKRN